MPHAYTPVDVALSEAIVFQYNGTPMQPSNQAGFNGNGIPFQFPPKITSDNRKGTWKDPEVRGTEPIANYITSGPREITLTTTYIVDGGKWTATRISNIVKTLRGYFTRIRLSEQQNVIGAENLIILIKLWGLGGKQVMSARMLAVNVKYSDTIVFDSTNDCVPGFAIADPNFVGPKQFNTDNAFPLRTDVTIDLRLWTRGGPQGKIQDLIGLKDAETPEWF